MDKCRGILASFEKQESSFAPRKPGLSRSERRQSDSYSLNDPYRTCITSRLARHVPHL